MAHTKAFSDARPLHPVLHVAFSGKAAEEREPHTDSQPTSNVQDGMQGTGV